MKSVRHSPPPLSLPTSPIPIYIYSNILTRYATPDDGQAIQDALKEMTQQGSVPNIFIGKQHIGGNSDLQAKKSELPDLLKKAGAV